MTGRQEIRTWQHNSAINALPKYRRACKYAIFLPDTLASALKVALDGTTVGLVSEAENAIRALNDVAKPGLQPLARLLLRTESIASSKVEGMQLGVRELAKAEARKDTGEKPSANAIEILSNIDAMQLAIEEASNVDRFSVKEIADIHHRLMKDAWNSHIAGKIRTQQNWIGGNDHNPCGADYVPPPPEDVPALLADLCDAINDDLPSPLVQAALVHAQFETIHPFDDGNGRTGRALIQIVLRRRQLASSYVPPISVILAKSKDRYIRGLERFREDDGLADWIELFADASARSATLAKDYLTAVQELIDQWRAKLKAGANPRADSVAWKVIDHLPAHPMITVPVAALAASGSRPSVYKAFQELQAAGVLIPLSDKKKNQSWEAAGLLELIGQLESGESLE